MTHHRRRFLRYFPLTLVILLLSSAALKAADSKRLTEMVRVAAGSFVMGSKGGPDDEKPQHKVELADFFIDRTPVTNAQLAQFLNSAGSQDGSGNRWYDTEDHDARIHRREEKWLADTGYENHPVVEVSWFGARAYADGRVNACQPRPNGRKRRVAQTVGNTRGGMIPQIVLALTLPPAGIKLDR